MDRSKRAQAIQVLQRHGYTRFTDDSRVARVLGTGRLGELVAVHWENGAYTLYVRRGGAHNLSAVARDPGGSLDGPVLAFRQLDIRALDATLSQLLRSPRKHPL